MASRAAVRRPLGLGLLLLASLSLYQHAAAFLLSPTTPRRAAGGATRMMAEKQQQGAGAVVDRRALVRNAGVGLSFLSGLALLQLPQEGRCVLVGMCGCV